TLKIFRPFDFRFGPYVIGQKIRNPEYHNCVRAAGSGRGDQDSSGRTMGADSDTIAWIIRTPPEMNTMVGSRPFFLKKPNCWGTQRKAISLRRLEWPITTFSSCWAEAALISQINTSA